ncbi:late embryogenesis abundant protein [Striga asiatica]|uniref:Late embryogenesis abundant protein n=1 Tax=Striga asiatica TaxID=4170 RepID=A0A5A7PRJ3_STRAF|nr:late embryogenesis abundant protein [Striga asiatica]
MTDRAYPSAKPNGAAPPPPLIPNPPPAKSHLYNPTRHPYRPTPTSHPAQKRGGRRPSCRRCCCLACLWTFLILIGLLLLAAVAAAALYALYHPRRPLFSVTSLRISAFNLTTAPSDDTTRLTAASSVTLSARNPNNRRITYLYGPATVSVWSGSVVLCSGSAAGFKSPPGNVSAVHAAAAASGRLLYGDDARSLREDLRKKSGAAMKIVVETTVGVKAEKMKVRKVGIRISCEGIHGELVVPKGKNVTSSNTANARCDLKIKIWKWTFGF